MFTFILSFNERLHRLFELFNDVALIWTFNTDFNF